MVSLVNSSDRGDHDISYRLVKWGQIWSFLSSLSDVKNAKKAENALNL